MAVCALASESPYTSLPSIAEGYAGEAGRDPKAVPRPAWPLPGNGRVPESGAPCPPERVFRTISDHDPGFPAHGLIRIWDRYIKRYIHGFSTLVESQEVV